MKENKEGELKTESNKTLTVINNDSFCQGQYVWIYK
jgi:hypothetical protein